jgi:predicted kinase
MNDLISVREFERKVMDLEEITFIINEPAATKVPDYTYTRKAAGNTSINEWLEQRIKTTLKGNNLEFTILNGEHVQPNKRTNLCTLRDSYSK